MKLLDRLLWLLLPILIAACTLKRRATVPPAPATTIPPSASSPNPQPAADAQVVVDARQVLGPIPTGLWGTNLTNLAPAAETVENPAFVQAARQIGITVVRWPGGNNADAYDWKHNVMIKPGRRIPQPDGVDLARILRFVQETGAELSVTVNFGTLSAQDAADLVEFLNGPADSPWGAQRAALGFPDPLNVRYFEIGNEINQPHMWYYAWTAESPEKYFFGGDEERRGFYNNIGSQDYDPVGAKGDLFKANGEPNQTYTLRFPPVREVEVLWAASRQDAETGRLETWQRVDDWSTQPPDAQVYTLDEATGTLRFGDGVHGAIPPAGSFFLVEYTTTGHDGFLDFARAMRAAPSAVPIQIGAAMLPFRDGHPIADEAQMRDIFAQMDFYVRHQYDNAAPVSAWDAYATRRQFAADRVEILEAVYRRLEQYTQSLGQPQPPAIAITEWNVFLNQDYWHINRTLEGGVIAAEWFIRLLNARERLPVLYANQFALGGGNLALIRSQSNGSIAPMGYVFQGFADWPGSEVVQTTVTAPEALAYDKPIPLIAAAAALSPDGSTLRVALVNNSKTERLGVSLELRGFTASEGTWQRLSAEDYAATNDDTPDAVTLRSEPPSALPAAWSLPPHSVTFLTLKGNPSR